MDLSFLYVKDDYILHGSQHYINECYSSAIVCFTQAVKENKKKVNAAALLYRGFSYAAMGDHKNAIKDYDEVEKTGEKLFEVFYKRGISYFFLQDYAAAHENFLKSIAISQSPEQRENIDRWMSKLKTELSKEIMNKLQNASSSSTSSTTTQCVMFKPTWDQDANFIYLNLEALSSFDTKATVVKIEKRQVSVEYKSTQVYTLALCNAILPDQSRKEFVGDTLKLALKKEIDNFNWINVDKNKASESSSFQQSYPSSSKKKKDWDEVEKDIQKQLNAEPDEEGINTLFKQIYARGDEETRRAMIKSFQTSGGTVLSTNWGEVKEKDYEGKDRPEPPKGQEWKKPEY